MKVRRMKTLYEMLEHVKTLVESEGNEMIGVIGF